MPNYSKILRQLGKAAATEAEEATGKLATDEAARLARAKEMGFDVENPFYHATDASENFSAFDPNKQLSGIYTGTHLAENPEETLRHIGTEVNASSGNPSFKYKKNARIIPVYTRGKIFDLSKESAEDILKNENLPARASYGYKNHVLTQKLKELGYSGIKNGNETVIFDPKNIRSKWAKFDPSKADSSDLSAALAGATLAGGAAMSPEDAKAAAEDSQAESWDQKIRNWANKKSDETTTQARNYVYNPENKRDIDLTSLISDEEAKDDRIEPTWDAMDFLPVEKVAGLAALAAKAGGGIVGKAGLIPLIRGGLKVAAKDAVENTAEKAAGALAMDEASRMARAKEMGFDTSRTWYHGTKADIQNFDPNALGASTNAPSSKRGFFFTTEPSTASDYAALSKDRVQLRSMSDYNAAFDAYGDAQRALFKKYGPDMHELEPGFALLDNLQSTINYYQESLSKMRPDVPLAAHYRELIANKQKEMAGIYEAYPRLKEASIDPLWHNTKNAKSTLDAAEIQAHAHYDADPLGDVLKTDPRMKALDKKIDDAFAEYRAQPDADAGYSDQSWKTQNIYSKARELEQQGRDLREQIAQEIENKGSNVIPTKLKMENPYTHDFKGQDYRDESYNNILKKAKEAGHDSVLLKNTYDPANPLNRKLMDVGVVFEPSQVRSKFAKFDPTKADSTDISAGLAAVGLGAGAAGVAPEDAEASEGAERSYPALDKILRNRVK